MEASFPLLFAAIVGFGHAFEADHLVAVGNIVTKRDELKLAVKDGIYWGLGHTMLVLLGVYRLYEYFKSNNQAVSLIDTQNNHHLAYGVGLVHGLAGSGAMVLLVMTEIQTVFNSMIYLIIFGMGSIKEFLLFGLNHFNIGVDSHEGKMVYLEKDYTIEIEGKKLFKLLQNNQVIAPFSGVEELCEFIKKDIQLNEEN